VLGEGWHERAGQPHAEINALKAAGEHANGATVYLTLEPCCHHGRTPPCSQALTQAGVRRVVAAMRDPNPEVSGKGFEELEKHGIVVQVGLMEKEAELLNPGFIMRMTRNRPYVRLKLAASLDGRTAMVNGDSKWITGPAARADVQKWRARSSAILTGVNTVLQDDPSLTVRDFDIGRQPVRVVLDSRLRMPPTARMLSVPGRTLIATASQDRAMADKLRARGAEIIIVTTDKGRIDMDAMLVQLAAREVNELFVEAGETLAGSLISGGYVDELLLYYAPHVMGSHERSMFSLPALANMANRHELNVTDTRAIGRDWRLIASMKAVNAK
jgi:diaminohydroxyphosphoribosylaminopyrimidine deaminase/5-amino-6-(5-phosphoribosylamino)uracil reductase